MFIFLCLAKQGGEQSLFFLILLFNTCLNMEKHVLFYDYKNKNYLVCKKLKITKIIQQIKQW